MTEVHPEPFRIALLGDFSGRANRGFRTAIRAVPIDPDSFEDAMGRLGVALDLPAGTLPFRELDDFHPDRLYRNLPLFQPIHEARKQLSDPKAFRATAPAAPPATGGSLLDRIVEQSPGDEAEWDQAIRRIAAKHSTPGRDPQQEQAIALMDEAAAAQLRAILSHPDFQTLEAAWRSVFFLFRYVETGVELQIELIDISQDELLEKQAELTRLLAGERSWSLIAGLFTFSPDQHDCEVLSRMGAIGGQAGASFLAAMHPRLFGCESIGETPDPDDWKTPFPAADAQAWRDLRHSAEANWIGLAFPRFLLRLPYGKKTVPIESFDFEEMPHSPVHDAYLWGNPAAACAALLGQTFNQQDWEMRVGSVNRLEGLPVHSFANMEPTPTAEIQMTERFAAQILDAGIMPLASVKHSDAVLLVRFQSIADPPQPLAGPW